MDIALNQKVVSSDVGANYPYKAMIDFLLSTNTDMIQSEGEAALFHKDQPGAMEAVTYTGGIQALQREVDQLGVEEQLV